MAIYSSYLIPSKCSKYYSCYCFYRCCFWNFKWNIYSVEYLYVVMWQIEGVNWMLNNDHKWTGGTKASEGKCDSKANLTWMLTRQKQIFGCGKQNKYAHDQSPSSGPWSQSFGNNNLQPRSSKPSQIFEMPAVRAGAFQVRKWESERGCDPGKER